MCPHVRNKTEQYTVVYVGLTEGTPKLHNTHAMLLAHFAGFFKGLGVNSSQLNSNSSWRMYGFNKVIKHTFLYVFIGTQPYTVRYKV